MELSLYYVTNRGHQGKKQFKPDSYGIHPSKSGIENLRLGKVTVDAGVDSFEKWFQESTGAGPGAGVELGEYLTVRAENHATIEAYVEKIPDKQREESKQKGIKLGSQAMFKDVQDTMMAGRDVLVYVHGFNVSWWEAVGSALALQLMLNRPGTKPKDKGDVLVILYSWPSDGSALPFVAYRSDRTEAIGSGFALGRGLLKLRDFLADISRRVTEKEKAAGIQRECCDQHINILCHSMGNFVLQHAIQRVTERAAGNRLPRVFDHVFMCAPDVNDDVLDSDKPLGRLHEVCRNVNVYCNSGDLALHGSDYTKGNPDRLGNDGAANPLHLHRKVFQIDCSDIVDGFMEHSYYLQGRVNTDIRQSLDNVSQDDASRSRVPSPRFPNTYAMK